MILLSYQPAILNYKLYDMVLYSQWSLSIYSSQYPVHYYNMLFTLLLHWLAMALHMHYINWCGIPTLYFYSQICS